MIKSPIKRNGDIRYFELIKVAFLVSIFYACISKYLVSDSISLLSKSARMTNIILVIFVVNTLIITTFDFVELLISSIIKVIEHIRTLRKANNYLVKRILLKYRNTRYTITRTNIQLNVIRC